MILNCSNKHSGNIWKIFQWAIQQNNQNTVNQKAVSVNLFLKQIKQTIAKEQWRGGKCMCGRGSFICFYIFYLHTYTHRATQWPLNSLPAYLQVQASIISLQYKWENRSFIILLPEGNSILVESNPQLTNSALVTKPLTLLAGIRN